MPPRGQHRTLTPTPALRLLFFVDVAGDFKEDQI